MLLDRHPGTFPLILDHLSGYPVLPLDARIAADAGLDAGRLERYLKADADYYGLSRLTAILEGGGRSFQQKTEQILQPYAVITSLGNQTDVTTRSEALDLTVWKFKTAVETLTSVIKDPGTPYVRLRCVRKVRGWPDFCICRRRDISGRLDLRNCWGYRMMLSAYQGYPEQLRCPCLSRPLIRKPFILEQQPVRRGFLGAGYVFLVKSATMPVLYTGSSHLSAYATQKNSSALALAFAPDARPCSLPCST